MDSAAYADDLGVVDTRIADGELNRRGMGTAKKVAVGAGALVAGAGTFIGGCKLAGKLNSVSTKWGDITKKQNDVYKAAVRHYQNQPGYSSMTPDQMRIGSEKAGKAAVESAIAKGEVPKKSIFQKAADVKIFGQQGLFGEGVLGKGNIVGEKLSNHWSNIASKLKDGKGMESGFLNKVFGKMSNYPMLAAAGLAGAGFFIYKGIKKLINKRKGVDEPSFGR